jgi:hypothetical protein
LSRQGYLLRQYTYLGEISADMDVDGDTGLRQDEGAYLVVLP